MTFEKAHPGDAAAILRIFKATYPPDLLPLLPLGCSGAQNFLEDSISTKVPNPDTFFLVARDKLDKPDKSIKAFVESRLGLSSLFINWIHVAPEAQGKKLGSELLRFAIQTFCCECNHSISLDVAESNTRARAWYQRLGFADQHTTDWRLFTLHAGDYPPKFLVSVNAFDERMHKTYGFSTRKIFTMFGNFSIGVLGERYFRSTDPEDLNRAAILQAIDPDRELLMITSKPVNGGRIVNRLVRMSGEAQTILKNLGSQ
jgi:GNAT superfamily N-acetyltransferase